MLEAQSGSFLGSGGMLREGRLQMAEEIAPLPGMKLLSSENNLLISTYLLISEQSEKTAESV